MSDENERTSFSSDVFKPEFYGRCSGEWLLLLLKNTFFITKMLDFIISFELHLVYQAGVIILTKYQYIVKYHVYTRFL